ncbi:PD-(D/E)XK nuclease family protein [Methanofollis liminatans]|uniref:PD-(D/E)XK nuclease family protein n=1 Tax=Methanofollis liminatans TaxID=2201 RepID=UPI00145C3FFD|nr:PD-(D/E)XK nuclease family protein [Methanofollis liminatans]
MTGTYVPFDTLVKEPEAYKDQWIQSRARLSSQPYYATTQGGPKYLLNLEVPSGYRHDIRIVIWEHPPSWLPYTETSPNLVSLFGSDDEECKKMCHLFSQGEEVFFEGFLKYSAEIFWINVERILIAHPSIAIGPREIIGALHCPRIYYLEYIKNTTDNILRRPVKQISRGNVVHSICEHLTLSGEIVHLSEMGGRERTGRLREIVENETNTTFRMSSALHLLADDTLESVQKDAYFHLKDLTQETEVADFFRGRNVVTERMVNQLYGFSGVLDFLIDGSVPVELKTSSQLHEEHLIQLKVYLLVSYLDSGNRMGHLMYSKCVESRSSGECRHIHPVELTEEDIDAILYGRHRVLLMRRGMQLPSPQNMDCEECRYRRPSPYSLQKMYPACSFYCQTERYWDCYLYDEHGQITALCPLFDDCELKFSYFDTEIIDHWNKMRKAISAENEELTLLARQLRNLPEETLRMGGQKVSNLKLMTRSDQVCIFSSDEALPCLDCIPGDRVSISTEDGKNTYSGTLAGIGLNEVQVLFGGSPSEEFFGSPRYALSRDYSEKAIMRYLLRVSDYTERNRQEMRLSSGSRGKILETRALKEYDPVAVAKDLFRSKLVAIHSPSQTSDVERCVEILGHLSEKFSVLVVLRNRSEIEEFVQRYPRTHDLLIIDREEDFPPKPRVCEIGENNSPRDIQEKISLSRVIITDIGFLQRSHFFEALSHPERSYYFDYVCATGAEQFFEPMFYYIKNLGYSTLLIGDAFRMSYPVRSREARSLGLEERPFERLVLYDSYFESNDYAVYHEPFRRLPGSVVRAFEKIDSEISSERIDGNLTYIDVKGHERSVFRVDCLYQICMGDERMNYQMVIEPDRVLDAATIETLLENLTKHSISNYGPGSSFQVGECSCRVVQIDPLGSANASDPKENVSVVIRIPISLSETLQELLYSNEEEAEEVIALLKAMSPDEQKETAVITPFISQASLLKKRLYMAGIGCVSVWLPFQISGRSFRSCIISLVSANAERVIRYPLTDPGVLYTMFTSAEENLIVVGDRETIGQSRLIAEIISENRSPDEI